MVDSVSRTPCKEFLFRRAELKEEKSVNNNNFSITTNKILRKQSHIYMHTTFCMYILIEVWMLVLC